MRRLLCLGLSIMLLCLLFPTPVKLAMPVYAETMTDETKQLLEKGLSVVEIDREITRISGLRTAAEKSIQDNEKQLAEQEIAIVAQRERAGRVLRSYYMGEKDALLEAVLNSKSLSGFLRSLDLMDLVFQTDHDTLDRYQEKYKQLRSGYDKLKLDQAQLAKVETDLRTQRDRVEALQRQVELAIAGSADPDLLRKQMEEVQFYWKNVGLYEVQRHFNALAKAMNQLPDWVKDHPDMLKTSGLKTTLTISDTALNAFLQAKDPILKEFTISFQPGKLVLHGSSGSMIVDIEGHYTVENDPKNAILFHMDTLVFNGLTLPDTTRDDLVRDFDLGFYPQDLIKFVKADSVSLDEGQLIVRLVFGK